MELFYTDFIVDDIFNLKSDEYRHCTKVLRKKVGDTINATDAKGNLLSGSIIEISKTDVKIKITQKTFYKNNEKFKLAISPTKNAERIEWLVEKAVEIGIKSIEFIICEHSERKTVNIQRLEKIAVSAMKQSNKFWKPSIYEPQIFKKFVSSNKNAFIAHCHNSEKKFFKPENLHEDCLILIGPEGDFSPAEVNFALDNGHTEVSLGLSRLRTETAGLFACAVYNILTI